MLSFLGHSLVPNPDEYEVEVFGTFLNACRSFEISSLTSFECFSEFSNPTAQFVKLLGDVVNLLGGLGSLKKMKLQLGSY